MTRSVVSLLTLLCLAASVHSAAAGPADATLRVTQPALIAQCLNGTAVASATRSWRVSTPVTLAVTMRNQPRPGVADADPGTAIVQFTPEPGHRYEVEVRAAATTFSARVWTTGAWTPVVRDRTADRVVSSDPEWAAPPCTTTRQR